MDIDEYARRSATLLHASERFRAALFADERQQQFRANDLLAAAGDEAAKDVFSRFQPGGTSPLPRPSGPSALSAVLFDLQSGNLLIAAGLRIKELPAIDDGNLLSEAHRQIEASRGELVASDVRMQFAANLMIHSGDTNAAAAEFRRYSGELLDEIVLESRNTINTACKGLAKLDPSEVTKAIDQLGGAVPIVADVGRLVRQGLEKVKRAIEAVAELFGKDTLDKVKATVQEIWSNVKSLDHDLLGRLLGVGTVKKRIEQILAASTLTPAALDRATNTLPGVASEFTKNNSLLRALIRAIELVALLLYALRFLTGPWLAVALGIAYLTIIGGALLIGGEYTGGRQLLHWAQGVEQLAEAIG